MISLYLKYELSLIESKRNKTFIIYEQVGESTAIKLLIKSKFRPSTVLVPVAVASEPSKTVVSVPSAVVLVRSVKDLTYNIHKFYIFFSNNQYQFKHFVQNNEPK